MLRCQQHDNARRHDVVLPAGVLFQPTVHTPQPKEQTATIARQNEFRKTGISQQIPASACELE